MVMLEAHKGVCTQCPENTMASFQMAVHQGYDMIELDPNYTLDGALVVLHDDMLNRTARNPDGSELNDRVNIHEITLEQALKYDFGCAFSSAFAGERLPLLKDVFKLSEETEICLKIDNKFEHFPELIKEELYSMLAVSHARVGLTCQSIESVKEAVLRVPQISIHYDGPVDEYVLKELSKTAPKLTVWMPFNCPNTSWAKSPFAQKENCSLVRKYAALGIWIVSDEKDYQYILRTYSPDIVETDGTIKPVMFT